MSAPLQQQLINAALSGGFLVAADFALAETKRLGLPIVTVPESSKPLALFVLGAGASLLQQNISPLLFR